MPTLNIAQQFTRVAVDSIQSVMRRVCATARSVGEAIAAKLGWTPRSARVGTSTTEQIGIVETVGWVEKPSTPMRGKRWVSCLNPAYVLMMVCAPVFGAGSYTANFVNWTDNGTVTGLEEQVAVKGFASPQEASVYSWPRTSYPRDSYKCEIVLPNYPSYESVVVYRRGIPFPNQGGYSCALNGIFGAGPMYSYFGAKSVAEIQGGSWPVPPVTGTWGSSMHNNLPPYFKYPPYPPLSSHGYIEYVPDGVVPPKNFDCREADGNPIHRGISDKFQTDTDFSFSGGISFSRNYHSHYTAPRGTAIPFWRHSYERTVYALVSTPTYEAAYITRSNGQQLTFERGGSNWKPDADIADRLTELNDANNVRTGWKYYDAATENTELYNATGQLQSITTRAGVIQTLFYNASNQLTTVTDSYGRTLTFTYNASNATTGANNIATVTDHLGNVVSYTYDTANNLSTVTYPGGGSKTYHYNEPAYTANTNLPNALTGITDENGTRFATYKYDTQGRATSTEHAGGVEKYSLNYTSPYAQTIVTDPLGTARTYNFQTILGVVKTTGVSQPCPSCGGTQSQATTYDANGNIASRTDFNNKKSCFAYDLTRNLETTRVEGLLASESCTTALATPPNRADVTRLCAQTSR